MIAEKITTKTRQWLPINGLNWLRITTSTVKVNFKYLIYSILDGKDAKSTWENVVKAYKENKKPAKTGSAPKKDYIYAAEMTFVDGIKESEK
jgi:hypothetical protein